MKFVRMFNLTYYYKLLTYLFLENFAKTEDGKFKVQGEVTLADFFEFFNIKKDAAEYDSVTLSGLIAQLAGKVPAPGEEIKFENLTLKVLSVEYYKVTEVEVTVEQLQQAEGEKPKEE